MFDVNNLKQLIGFLPFTGRSYIRQCCQLLEK